MMDILAPLGSVEEVEMLVGLGAGEIYCGLAPKEWEQRFSGPRWLNRRNSQKGNLESFAQLNQVVTEAHQAGVRVFMTMNSPGYTGDQIPLILDIIQKAHQDCGVDGVIISDLGLMTALRGTGSDVPIHVSSVAATMNSAAVSLYGELGVQRIILPRSLSLTEIKELKGQAGDGMEWEAFILNDGCVYEEGFCHTTHHEVGAFCTQPWEYGFHEGRALGNKFSREALEKHLADYQSYIWYNNNCGCTVSQRGFVNGPCGLCAIPKLAELGINSLKVVGREANPYRKLASIQLVKAILELHQKGVKGAELIEKAKGLRDTPEYCSSGYMCYYPWKEVAV